MIHFFAERRTLTASVVSCVVVLCVSFVSQGECRTAPLSATPCSSYTTCDECVPNTKCLWCLSTNNCTNYPVPWLLPPASLCPLSEARWAMCWINFEALVITIAVVFGVIVLGLLVCCCCCCVRCKKTQPRPDWEEERYLRRREEMRQRAEERSMDRRTRHNEIRRKYGLMGDSDHPYSKFENE
ncbi:pituitary tumor-transforming gene 1 protein-interacting protein [Nelusetta ayraudi]|uniref:pituitary tumor-transforming gene 1 protein-interacting protein n=1 Tax=Nelusetta ayraudi TaxID=303726 RepID=UPI003F6EAB6A